VRTRLAGALAGSAVIAAWGMVAEPAAADPAAVVLIDERGLQPRHVLVEAGSEVEWQRLGEGTVSVVAKDGSFASGELARDETFALAFKASGIHRYRVVFEDGSELPGTVIVSAGDEGPTDGTTPLADERHVSSGTESSRGADGQEDGPPAGSAPAPAEGYAKAPPSHDAGAGFGRSVPGRSALGAVVLGQAGATTVTVVDNDYNPGQVEVEPGGTVTWNQTGELPHTVTADDGSFDSGEMGEGDSFSHAFSQPGTFPYYCEFHGGPGGVGMSGTVVVAAAGGGGDGGDGDGAPADEGAQTGGLADTGAPVGSVATAMMALVLVGGISLAAGRRRSAVPRVTGFERPNLLPPR
jgi:plastocyanin